MEFVWLAAPEAFIGGDTRRRRCARCGCSWACPTRRAARRSSRSRAAISPLKADLVIKALGFDPEDLPAMFGEPALGGHPLGHAEDRPPHLDDQPARRVRRRRHRARRRAWWSGRSATAATRRRRSHMHAHADGAERRDGRRASSADSARGVSGDGETTSTRSGRFVAAWHANAARLRARLRPVAGARRLRRRAWSPRSTASRAATVVQAGIDALKAVWHRGAVDADGKTGDGAGIHVEIPQDFFADAVQRGGAQADAGPRSRVGRCSCRAPTSARRSAAGRSSRPRSCASATRSTAGARCRSTSSASARRPTRRGPRSSRS